MPYYHLRAVNTLNVTCVHVQSVAAWLRSQLDPSVDLSYAKQQQQHALCKHVSPHCLCLTATRIYQAAFITMMTLPAKTTTTTTKLAKLTRQGEAARISSCNCNVVATLRCLPHVACVCLAHDLFLLRHSDNSNAICVSHRLYSLHVSFSTFMPPFLPGYFWHVAATAATAAASSSDCLVVASIFNAYVNNPLYRWLCFSCLCVFVQTNLIDNFA